MSDDQPNTEWELGIELANTEGDSAPEEVHIYVQVARVGIEVLRFHPNPTGAPPSHFEKIDHIDTPSGSGGISIRDVAATDEMDLLVSERNCGLRVFTRL